MSATAQRPYHHGNLRSELLSCAERALSAGGLAQLSLRDLARQVGVSHAAPRRHFADKQALLDALAQDGFERLGRELRAASEGAGEDFEARLAALAGAYVRFATRHAALLEPPARRPSPPRWRSSPTARAPAPWFPATPRRWPPWRGPPCRGSRASPTPACSTTPRSTAS